MTSVVHQKTASAISTMKWCTTSENSQCHIYHDDVQHQKTVSAVSDNWGAGIAQWLERRTRDRKVPGSSPGRRGGRISFSRVNCLCWLLFRYPFHTRVTAVAIKRSRSFCQKCRWHVTDKHTYTLPMWIWMKWHCNLVHGWMVYTELARRQHFTWHQPCNIHRALPEHHFRGY